MGDLTDDAYESPPRTRERACHSPDPDLVPRPRRPSRVRVSLAFGVRAGLTVDADQAVEDAGPVTRFAVLAAVAGMLVTATPATAASSEKVRTYRVDGVRDLLDRSARPTR